MIYIIKVSPTVGKSEVVAVITSLEAKNLHTPFNVWVEDNFGQFSTAEYIEQSAVADTGKIKVDRILDFDNSNYF